MATGFAILAASLGIRKMNKLLGGSARGMGWSSTEMTDKSIIDTVKQTLSEQEARVVRLMREHPYQTIVVVMENAKVVNKKQTKSIED